MATVRASSVRERRLQASALYKIARSGRRVLPLSDFSQRLANQSQDAIDEDFARRYNDGLISPEEYSDHLTSMLRRSGLSSTDRVKISDAIRDVKRNAELEVLQSVYTQAEPGSPEKIDAANALSMHFATTASELSPGSPAHSQALADQARWARQAVDEKDAIEKAQRTSTRLTELARISQMDSSDPQTAMEKAQLYTDLKNQALTDGEMDEALRYEASANKELENAQTLQNKAVKTDIVDYMNENLNLYQDNKIGPYDMLAALDEAEKAADATGDFSLAIRVNTMRERIEKDIERAGKSGAASFKKQALEELDTIELDLKRLEDSFRLGTVFKPESELFKQFVKGEGTPDLEDMVTMRALGFSAVMDVIDQMEKAGIDVPESRRATLEESLGEAGTQREAFFQGRLVAVIDPGTGEVNLEDLDTPEEAANIYTDPATGLSYSIINKNEGSTFEDLQRAVNSGYASPSLYASAGTLMQGGQFQLMKKNKFAGIDWLSADRELDLDPNTAIYQTDEKDVYAIRESDVKEGGDPNKYLKVQAVAGKSGVTNLNVLDEETAPKFTIDPVIVVPSPDGGLERIYLKKNPVTGAIESYYSERRNRVLQQQELEPLLRGKGLEEAVQPQGPVAPTVEEPTVVSAQPDIVPQSTGQKVSSIVSGIASGGISLPQNIQFPKIEVPQFVKPTAGEREAGARLKGSEYDQPQFLGYRPSQILNPQTTGEKIVSGGLRIGEKIQTTLQKIPLLGKLIPR